MWFSNFKVAINASILEAMIQSISLTKKSIIIGLGVTGFAVARFLHVRGVPFVMMDTNPQPARLAEFQQLFPLAPVQLGPLNASALCQAKQIIISPGVPLATSALQQALQVGVEVIGEVELFAREVGAPVIAITGSNGKSTVTSLVGVMAQQAGRNVAVGGNLGTPALDLLLDNPAADLFVLELSSFQLETLSSLKLAAATILNISADHCDRYPSPKEYVQAKQCIYQHAKTAVYNLQDALTKPSTANHQQVITFSLTKPDANQWGIIIRDQQEWLAKGSEPLLPAAALKLSGRHNIANALAACALAQAVGIGPEALCAGLQQFTELAHRCQWVGEWQNIRFINDSKGTNVGATLAALQGLATTGQPNIVLIAGGDGKDADFSPLLDMQSCLRAVVLLGKDALRLQAVLSPKVPCYLVPDLASGVNKAGALAKTRDTVLLSPACSSLDMFRDYAHRGEQFTQLALQWMAAKAKETVECN